MARRSSWAMSRNVSTATMVAAGAALLLVLLQRHDFGRVLDTLHYAGWSILFVVALHLPQTLVAASAWRPLIAGEPPSLWTIFAIRWTRDSVNTLLPVARVGGDVVRVRLLARQDVPIVDAAASAVADVTLEMAAQIVFTIGAVALLMAGPHALGAGPLALWATFGCTVATAAFLGAQHLGLLKLFERLASRIERVATLRELSGLHERVLALYRQPRRIAPSACGHLLAWLLGGLETYAALTIIGLHAPAREAIVIEALVHASRAAGFFIPGALGVQEGGYILVCGLFGIAPHDALALSLIRRLRELIVGVPGLIAWHQFERPAVPAAEAA